MENFIKKLRKQANLLNVDEDLLLREEFQKTILIGMNLLQRASNLVFQGGSALHIFYNNPRFSLDLDFVGKFEINTNKLSSWLNDILEPTGFEASISKIKKRGEPALARFWIKIKNENLAKTLKIKMESFEGHPPPSETHLLVSQFLPLKIGAVINVETAEGLLAQKIFALASRKYIAARDLFDITFLRETKGVKLDKKVLEEVNKNYGVEKTQLSELLNTIKNMEKKEIAQKIEEIKILLPTNYNLEKLIPLIHKSTINAIREAIKLLSP
ncbi:MAG: nucleotidyl transferase AbiEii/AbiGii toxin family protein [Candidatus Njordarchaeia archaeon]